jgi:hypothetical protein
MSGKLVGQQPLCGTPRRERARNWVCVLYQLGNVPPHGGPVNTSGSSGGHQVPLHPLRDRSGRHRGIALGTAIPAFADTRPYPIPGVTSSNASCVGAALGFGAHYA